MVTSTASWRSGARLITGRSHDDDRYARPLRRTDRGLRTMRRDLTDHPISPHRSGADRRGHFVELHNDTQEARRVLRAEASAIAAVADRIGDEFTDAVDLLTTANRVHFSGVGKSGHVARHIAAKMSSTGKPADFLHPTDALHGDLGRVQAGDTVVLISRSGECAETLNLLSHLTGPTIALTGSMGSSLALGCTVTIDCGAEEACPHGLVPSSSTAATQAMGDALVFALMARAEFSADDFRATHPSGALGAQ